MKQVKAHDCIPLVIVAFMWSIDPEIAEDDMNRFQDMEDVIRSHF